jgi:hypothetical protein
MVRVKELTASIKSKDPKWGLLLRAINDSEWSTYGPSSPYNNRDDYATRLGDGKYMVVIKFYEMYVEENRQHNRGLEDDPVPMYIRYHWYKPDTWWVFRLWKRIDRAYREQRERERYTELALKRSQNGKSEGSLLEFLKEETNNAV